MANIESELEEEIRLELERLEQIFNEETIIESSSAVSDKIKPNRVSYSAYEYAEAEGEKEELEDQLKSLVSKTDDYNAQILNLTRANSELIKINEQLQIENAKLRNLGQGQGDVSYGNFGSVGYESYSALSPGSVALEHLLAETRTKLLQTEAAYQDIITARDAMLHDLEQERSVRIHAGKVYAHPSKICMYLSCSLRLSVKSVFVEKERDAYSAAYEASLQHFEKWTKSQP